MSISFIVGASTGKIISQELAILDLTWGKMNAVDLYIGLFLFCMWIIYRERSTIQKILWIILILLMGNWTTSLYVFLAIRKSNGSWRQFFQGARTGKDF
ncbi:DUF1475 family protein [Bacillaceae bacterium S4-13-58]